MSPTKRQQILAAALLATLLAAWLAPDRPEDSGTAMAALPPLPDLLDWPRPPEPLVGVSADLGLDKALAAAHRPARNRATPADDAASSAKPPASAIPPAPPFRMFGRFERDGETVAFVTHAGRTLTVSAGQPLPGDWQVESIGSDGMVLTYLPLGQTARIPFKAPAQ